MACHTTGIQQLLAAEKVAAEKVGEARKRTYENISIKLLLFLNKLLLVLICVQQHSFKQMFMN